MNSRFLAFGLVIAALLSQDTLLHAQPKATEKPSGSLADHFGFQDIELFKLSRRSGNLICRDFNGDDLIDAAVVDNSNSRIDLLIQRSAETEAAKKSNEVNEVSNDQRFEHRKLPVDRQIATMAAGDFNHDGKVDLAYFAVPDRLIIRYQPEMGDWTNTKSVRLPDVPAASWGINGGDLNGDNRDDIVVLGKSTTYVLYQAADGSMESPTRLFNTSEKLGIAQIVDVNGDGRKDLCYRSDEGSEPTFCCRFQNEKGKLGPELEFELPSTRGIVINDLDGEPGAELLGIDGRTGRVRVWKLEKPSQKSGELSNRMTVYGFGGETRTRGRDFAAGDIDGDGHNDLVMTDPNSAQLLVFRQSGADELDLGTAFPSLSGTTNVRIANIDKSKAGEVFVLSPKERTLGIARMENGRLSFPEPLPIQIRVGDDTELEPQVFEIADLDGDKSPEALYVCQAKEGRTTSYQFRALTLKDGKWSVYKFGEEDFAPINVSSTIARLQVLDANKDGRPDFLVFLSSDRGTHLFVTNKDGVPEEIKTEGGIQLGRVSPGSLFTGNGKDTGILVAQESFARSLELGEGNRWRVVDQYNSNESNTKIEGVSALDLDGEPGEEIVLIDTGVKKLRVLRKEDSLYQPWKEVELGGLAYEGNRVTDLNGDGKDDLLLMGRGRFAVLYAGQTEPELAEVASFQTQLKKAFFADLACGDLNHDGRKDLAVIDTRSHQIEILHFARDKTLKPALHFQVFEEKSFQSNGQTGVEPREIVIADVTGDGNNDLLLIAHDRLLIYPQDPGAPAREVALDHITEK